MYKTKTLSELNKLYNDAEACDSPLFSEQRSNVLLASGDHYTRKHSIYWSRIRDGAHLSEETKLRITKNHIHKICNTYVNNIYSIAPDVGILPKNEKILHDQKAAELRSKVWQDWKERNRFRERVRSLVDDFVKVGEVAVKVFYDPTAGKFLGYEQAPEVDEMGMPVLDEMGQPVMKQGNAVFSGDIVVESLFAANLLRDPNGTQFKDTPWIIRKVADAAPLQAKYKDTDKEKFVNPSSNGGVYTVFDGNNGNFYKTKDQLVLREFYFHPSEECPEGYFYIATESGILEEGPLPFGIYPIIMEGFDEIQTSPRKRSIIKQLRPVQAELNRAASQAAMHQITLGDDKVLVQSGTKVTQASKLPGVRVLTYAGIPPTILSGRAGDQFVSYIEMQQREMYAIANLEEEIQEKQTGNIDPYAELFKSIRNKKKYALYGEKIFNFISRIWETVDKLAVQYYSDEKLAEIFGPDDISNIYEYRNLKGGTDVRVVEQNEDVETKMGKQLSLQSIIQYTGSNLEKDDIGRLIRAMPFLNKEEIFSDYTTDYDNVTNDILALDRGEVPSSNRYDNHKYIIKRLVNRTKAPGFRYLNPEIQRNYYLKIQEHEQLEQQQLQAIKAAQADMIPSGGYLVGCDFYVTDPENPSRTRRARIPYESLSWLVKRLEEQGSKLEELEKLQQGVVAEMAGKMISDMASGTISNQGYQPPTGRPIQA